MNHILGFCHGIKFAKFQIKKIESDIASLEHSIIENFIPILEAEYEKSPPKMGEVMMFVDFEHMYAHPVVICDINEDRYRAKESEHCFHRFSLKMDVDNYITATFVISMRLFYEMQERFKFNVLESRL